MSTHCSGNCPFTDAATKLAAIEANTLTMAAQLTAINKTVFIGNGEPSLLSRVTALESTGTAKGGMWTKILAVLAIVMSAVSAFWKH